MDFTGKHVLITGGSTGIGRATAEKIASLGGKVTLLARRADVLEETARAIGPAALAIPCDVGDKASLLAALDKAIAQNGPLDGLFLNAAAPGTYALTSDYTDEAFEETLRVNVWSPFWALRHVLPAMISARQGRGADHRHARRGARHGGQHGLLCQQARDAGPRAHGGDGSGSQRRALQLPAPRLHRHANDERRAGRGSLGDGGDHPARADRAARRGGRSGRPFCCQTLPVTSQVKSWRLMAGCWEPCRSDRRINRRGNSAPVKRRSGLRRILAECRRTAGR